MKIHIILLILLISSLVLSACAITALETNLAATPTETQEPAATLTAIPTPIPKPTEDPYRFDIEKFHSFPQSYEYLLAHPDEFVQAPDPLTDRAAFDKWWNEAFIPALGPVSERPLTVNTLNCGDSRISHMCNADLGRMPVLEQPTFFWFVSSFGGSRVVYPVPCVNTTNSVFPGVTKYTLCPALVDIVPLASNGTDSLEMFTQGVDMIFTEVYIDLSYRSDVDWGGVDQLMDALGGSYNDPDNCVRFGFGTIVFLAE